MMPAGALLPYRPNGEAKFDVHKEYQKEQRRLLKLFKIRRPDSGIPKPLEEKKLAVCQLDDTGHARAAKPFKSIVHMKKVLLLLYSSWNHRQKILKLPAGTLLPWKHDKKKRKRREQKEEKDEKEVEENDSDAKYDAHHYYNKIKITLARQYGFASYPVPAPLAPPPPSSPPASASSSVRAKKKPVAKPSISRASLRSAHR